MRLWVLLREAAATTWANKVPTVLIMLLSAVMVAATLATVGRTAAAEQQLEQRLDEAGSRVLRIVDGKTSGLLSPAVVAGVGGLNLVERAVGTTQTIDVVAGSVGSGATRVPAWGIVGDITDVVTITHGRVPGPGEAVVSVNGRERLGFEAPYGWVVDAAPQGVSEFAIVGEFAVRPPFEEYGDGILYNAGEVEATVLSVVLRDAQGASAVQGAVLGIIAPTDITELAIESPIGIAELRGQVMGDFGSFGRTLLFGVLGGGALLVAIVVLADVLVRRKDLGRRRALGATRGTIIALVTCRTLLAALLGTVLGAGVGVLVGQRLGSVPPNEFVLAVAVLAVLAATCSAVPPALFAVSRDPVAVLRTP